VGMRCGASLRPRASACAGTACAQDTRTVLRAHHERTGADVA
jgi:hypothetical protein